MSQPGSEISEITEENLAQEMKQAESGFLIAPSEIFFEFRRVDHTRRMGETMAPDGESGNGLNERGALLRRIFGSYAPSKCGL